VDVKYDRLNGILIVDIIEEIDHHSTVKIRTRIDYEIEKNMPKITIFNFRNVTFMDSAGIGMLIGRYKLASCFGGKLYMTNVKSNIKKIFEMTGVLKIVPIIENLEEVGGKEIEQCI